jgi:ribosome-associated protein
MLPVDKTQNAQEVALALGALLKDHNGQQVVVMDLREFNGWTDFFVIATATSGSHLQGMERHVKDYCRDQDLDILRRSPRLRGELEDDWRLTDLGAVVIHLMSEKSRAFYELERLWSAAPVIFQG